MTGRGRYEFVSRLGDSWRDVVDALDIPPAARRRFTHGYEAQDLWEWLYDRQRLSELPVALRHIGRSDLAEVLEEDATQTTPVDGRMPLHGDDMPARTSPRPDVFGGRTVPRPVGRSLALLHTGHNLLKWDRGPLPRLGGAYRVLTKLAEDTLPIREGDLGDFSATLLQEARLVILVAPKDRSYSAAEIDHLVQYVMAGGSLLVMAYYWWRSDHDTNLGDLTEQFGIHLQDDRVEAAIGLGHAFRPFCSSQPPIQVSRPVAVPFSCSMTVAGNARPLLVTDDRATAAAAKVVDRRIVRESELIASGPLVVGGGGEFSGGGRVLVIGSWEAFLDDFVKDPKLGNEDFLKGALRWLTTQERLVR